jgi:hypothetical protein
MTRIRPYRRAAASVVLAGVALVAASCGSGGNRGSSSGPTPDAKLKEAGHTVLSQIAAYDAATEFCATQPTKVACVESADRTLGGQIHTYANLLALGGGFTAPSSELASARNSAQTLANSLEILGDAQPTQANYEQVLNTFNLDGALEQLKSAIGTLNAHL